MLFLAGFRIPDGGPYYLTIDADGLDPTIMPAVNAPTPGGLRVGEINVSHLACLLTQLLCCINDYIG